MPPPGTNFFTARPSHKGLMHAAREARLDPCEGGIDIATIVNRLPELPYALEVPNLERVKALGYLEHAGVAYTAKKYFSAHPRDIVLRGGRGACKAQV